MTRSSRTQASYLTPEDLALLAEVKQQREIQRQDPNNHPAIQVGDLIEFKRYSDQYEEPNIGFVIKVYEPDKFYVKVLRATTCTTKKWTKFGTMFNGKYVTTKSYQWNVIASCWADTYITENHRNVVHKYNPTDSALPKHESRNMDSTEKIDIYFIDDALYGNAPLGISTYYVYAMINGSYGEFEEVKNMAKLKDYKANAVRKARINKLNFQMKG